MSEPPPVPRAHQAIAGHLRSIEAELAFISNLRALPAEIPPLPAAETTARVHWCWVRIRGHLSEALLIADQEGEASLWERVAAEGEP